MQSASRTKTHETHFLARFLHVYFLILFTVLGVSSFKLLAMFSAPVAIVKTGISVIHGYVASMNIGVIDVAEREAQREREAAKKPQ